VAESVMVSTVSFIQAKMQHRIALLEFLLEQQLL
jgi:hypothetical protein